MRLASLFLLFTSIGYADTVHPWPEFRGPRGNGISAAENLPGDISEASESLKWKTELEGRGWSSPVVTAGGKIWLTTAVEESPKDEAERVALLEKKGEDPKKYKQKQIAARIILRAVEMDYATGKVEREIDLITLEAPDAIHTLNSYASPTPVLDGNRLYCHFGTFGTACLDSETGEVVWQEAFPLEHGVGPGSSPFVHGDLLILIQDGVDQQYVTALDKLTGKTVWKVDRPEMRAEKGDNKKSYNTPIAITDSRGREQLVCMGSQWMVAYEPVTGEELWKLDHGSGFSVVPRPVYSEKHGLLYFSTGFGKPELWAINPAKDGEVIWKETKRIPARPSPLVVGDEIYVLTDTGIATCLNAVTGETIWQERVGGNYSASPMLADGKIYFLSHEGDVILIEPGRKFAETARTQLDGQLMASPIALDGELLLRSDKAVYLFAN